jgi:predicted DNA-binding antitoxin AbrB/MazE fold protein
VTQQVIQRVSWYDEEDALRTNSMTVAARYENGVFRPVEGLVLAEGTLVEVIVPPVAELPRKAISSLGFAGMWANREDMPDSVSYVDNLRDHPRHPRD